MQAELEVGDSSISNANGVAVFPLKPNVPVAVLAELGNGTQSSHKTTY
jgi:hypothetical protein